MITIKMLATKKTRQLLTGSKFKRLQDEKVTSYLSLSLSLYYKYTKFYLLSKYFFFKIEFYAIISLHSYEKK